MARKQKDYLTALLADEIERQEADATGGEPEGAPAPRADRARRNSLLGRESALARVASGEVRQVTQIALDPARVRPWAGNARSYNHLNEENCRELIDAIIAEGGQKVPAIVRRVDGDPTFEFEVIAGTRRHWSISWLRQNSYPDMKFLAQIADLDDEAAFRLADIENRARKDVSDLERARNYAAALKTHYGNHQSRMAERLKLSQSWLSKMIKVATIPDTIVAAFASPADVQLKPAYPLAMALSDPKRARSIQSTARDLAAKQADLREAGKPPLSAQDVIKTLLAADQRATKGREIVLNGAHDRPAVSLQGASRQGVTLRLHAGHGLSDDELLAKVKLLLETLAADGGGLQR
jgi:ParB family chromosome partitioning protein